MLSCSNQNFESIQTMKIFIFIIFLNNKLLFPKTLNLLISCEKVILEVSGGSNGCASTGCVVDLNSRCPTELRVGEGKSVACRSACEAFGKPEYCCSGEFGSPDKCQPSVYSQVFKSACPQSYSYAYDDASSTFTCVGASDYIITFCPASSPTR